MPENSASTWLGLNESLKKHSYFVMSSSEHTLSCYFPLFINFHLCCVIVHLKYSGNPKEALQGRAQVEENRGMGDGTWDIAIEEEWEGATGSDGLLR